MALKIGQKIKILCMTLIFFVCSSGFVLTINHCCQCVSNTTSTEEGCSCCEDNDGSEGHHCKDNRTFIIVKIQDEFTKTEYKTVNENPILPIYTPFLNTQVNIPLNTQNNVVFSPLSPPPLLLTGRDFINFTHQRVYYALV